ncbi:cellulase family glycosylhydrolase [Segatella sp.]|uniref:cellulase family glycosylhydrolase n=1 Tax=Segatella sp. TaxID=2974253 RepID=UPI0030784E12
MKKITILSFLIMAFAMVSFSACSDEDTIGGGEGLSKDFVVSRSDMAFTKNGGETDLYVKAAQVPTVSTEAAWLAVTPVAGSSSITHHFLIKAEENTANDDRSATITVAAGSDTKTITVSQNSTEGLLISSGKTMNVGAAGGQVTVTLKANASYSQVISNDWVSEITSRANMVEYTRNYSVAANISNARSATISYTMVVNDSTSITEAVTINQEQGTTTGDMSKTAMDIAALMYPGWNLGNTMEAGNAANNWKNAGIGSETFWQSAKTTQQLIDLVKASGFKSVRIPCSWVMGHITDAEACTIDADWLTRVHEVVDYCIKNNLYVIINQHWDGGWIEHNGMTANADIKTTKAQLTKIWTQIADNFKTYDEHLLFAGMNEPGVGAGEGDIIGVADMSNRIAEYEQTFIEAVRATGGNNAKRVLIVQGPNTDIDKFVANNYMSKIKDSATDRLMVEVHFYDPYQFTDLSEDKDWGKYYLYWGKNNTNGSEAGRTADAKYNEDYVEAQMKKMKTNFFDKGYPVVIGEFGANQRLAIGKDAVHDASVKDYYKAVVTSAINNGCVPMAWDTNGNYPSMTIFNRAGASVSNANMLESITAGVAAAKWPAK